MKAADNLYKLINKLKIKASAELDKRVHDDITMELSKSERTKSPAQKNIGRIIMKSQITKLAAAACVVLAIIFGMRFFVSSSTSVALADVLQKVEQVQAFRYKMKMNMTGNIQPGMPSINRIDDYTITTSNTYGTRSDITTTDVNTGRKETRQTYMLPERKLMLTIMPEQKKYQRTELDDDEVARIKTGKQSSIPQNSDPRDIIKGIMNVMSTELGRSEIDGVEVEGFQTTDPAVMGGMMKDVNMILWVDRKTKLPVRMEMDFKMGEQLQVRSVIYDYQCDVSVDANEFEPVIPEGFTSLTDGTIRAPSGTENGAIEGLKFFAEIIGHYPKNLNIMNLLQEYTVFMQESVGGADINTGEVLKLMEKLKAAANKLEGTLTEEFKGEWNKLPEEEKFNKIMEKINLPEEEKIKIKRIMEKTRKKTMEKTIEKGRDMSRLIQSLGMFYMTLVQEKKEPAYYGDIVGPNDADADKVLLRWKLSDTEYRVIYGNLAAETVSVEKLAELESKIPKQ
jgi:acyl-CoA-binding protein